MDNSPDVDAGQDVVIGRITKNKREHIRVALGAFKGRRHVGVRVWFTDPVDGIEKPTGKGLNIRIDHLRDFAALVDKAISEAIRLEWFDLR